MTPTSIIPLLKCLHIPCWPRLSLNVIWITSTLMHSWCLWNAKTVGFSEIRLITWGQMRMVSYSKSTGFLETAEGGLIPSQQGLRLCVWIPFARLSGVMVWRQHLRREMERILIAYSPERVMSEKPPFCVASVQCHLRNHPPTTVGACVRISSYPHPRIV